LHNFGALNDFDVVIVDEDTPFAHIERMEAQGINVVVARTNARTGGKQE
jgi:DeoR/GlpR family transcriptional regulator of sugar metabolism